MAACVKGLKTVSDILINKPEIRTLIPHIVIRPIHCAAMDGYRPCMLLNTLRKPLQCMADCEPARQAWRRHRATWPRCGMRVCR